MTTPNQPAEQADSQRESLARKWAGRIGVLTLIGTTALVCIVLARSSWDPLRLAHLGTRYSEGDLNGTAGYDGQFFYFIARDGVKAVPLIDGASLRYMRIVYPLLVRILALGQPAIVPWALILVNVLAHSAGAALITYLMTRWGASPWYGLVYSVWIGALLALVADLSEPLCFALALAGIAAYNHRRIGLTVLFLVLSTLTKELGLVFAGGLAFHAALGRGRWRDALLIWGGPLGAFVGWLLIMRVWLDEFPTRYPAAKLHIPLYGWYTLREPVVLALTGLWLALPAALLTLIALVDIGRTRRLSLSTAVLLAGAGFTMTMPDVSWEDLMAAFRVGMPMMISGLLFLADNHPRILPLTAALWSPGILVAILVVRLM